MELEFGLAFIVTLLVAVGLALLLIPMLRRIKAEQTIREDGPVWHNKKQGTPTMGGVMFIFPVIIVASIVGYLTAGDHDFRGGFVILCAVLFGLIGFIDDIAKVKKKKNKGLSALQKLNLVPKYILLTHGHFDHILAVPDLAAAFPLSIAIHKLDSGSLGKDAYKSHAIDMKAAIGNTFFLDALWKDMPPPDILLNEGDKIGPFSVLHTPGHTPGSIALLDRDEGVLFTGDTLFCDGYGRTDLPGGNEKQLFESLRRLSALDGKIKVHPGHGDTTTIKAEANRYMMG